MDDDELKSEAISKARLGVKIAAGYTVIRNLRGNWPEWCVDLDDGRVVFIYIRYGEVRVGVGPSEVEASNVAEEVREGEKYGGVVGVFEALELLQELGYYYVCPTYREAETKKAAKV